MRDRAHAFLDRLTVSGGALLVTEDYIRATSVDASNDGSIDSPDLVAYLSQLDFGILVPMTENGKQYSVPAWYALAVPEGAKYSLLSQWVMAPPTDERAVADLQRTMQTPLCFATALSLPSWSQQSCDFIIENRAGYLRNRPLSKPVLLASLTYTSREIEPESGLYYYRARFYDPEVGRFVGICANLSEHGVAIAK